MANTLTSIAIGELDSAAAASKANSALEVTEGLISRLAISITPYHGGVIPRLTHNGFLKEADALLNDGCIRKAIAREDFAAGGTRREIRLQTVPAHATCRVLMPAQAGTAAVVLEHRQDLAVLRVPSIRDSD
jgi:hypothetical protein